MDIKNSGMFLNTAEDDCDSSDKKLKHKETNKAEIKRISKECSPTIHKDEKMKCTDAEHLNNAENDCDSSDKKLKHEETNKAEIRSISKECSPTIHKDEKMKGTDGNFSTQLPHQEPSFYPTFMFQTVEMKTDDDRLKLASQLEEKLRQNIVPTHAGMIDHEGNSNIPEFQSNEHFFHPSPKVSPNGSSIVSQEREIIGGNISGASKSTTINCRDQIGRKHHSNDQDSNVMKSRFRNTSENEPGLVGNLTNTKLKKKSIETCFNFRESENTILKKRSNEILHALKENKEVQEQYDERFCAPSKQTTPITLSLSSSPRHCSERISDRQPENRRNALEGSRTFNETTCSSNENRFNGYSFMPSASIDDTSRKKLFFENDNKKRSYKDNPNDFSAEFLMYPEEKLRKNPGHKSNTGSATKSGSKPKHASEESSKDMSKENISGNDVNSVSPLPALEEMKLDRNKHCSNEEDDAIDSDIVQIYRKLVRIFEIGCVVPFSWTVESFLDFLELGFVLVAGKFYSFATQNRQSDTQYLNDEQALDKKRIGQHLRKTENTTNNNIDYEYEETTGNRGFKRTVCKSSSLISISNGNNYMRKDTLTSEVLVTPNYDNFGEDSNKNLFSPYQMESSNMMFSTKEFHSQLIPNPSACNLMDLSERNASFQENVSMSEVENSIFGNNNADETRLMSPNVRFSKSVEYSNQGDPVYMKSKLSKHGHDVEAFSKRFPEYNEPVNFNSTDERELKIDPSKSYICTLTTSKHKNDDLCISQENNSNSFMNFGDELGIGFLNGRELKFEPNSREDYHNLEFKPILSKSDISASNVTNSDRKTKGVMKKVSADQNNDNCQVGEANFNDENIDSVFNEDQEFDDNKKDSNQSNSSQNFRESQGIVKSLLTELKNQFKRNEFITQESSFSLSINYRKLEEQNPEINSKETIVLIDESLLHSVDAPLIKQSNTCNVEELDDRTNPSLPIENNDTIVIEESENFEQFNDEIRHIANHVEQDNLKETGNSLEKLQQSGSFEIGTDDSILNAELLIDNELSYFDESDSEMFSNNKLRQESNQEENKNENYDYGDSGLDSDTNHESSFAETGNSLISVYDVFPLLTQRRASNNEKSVDNSNDAISDRDVCLNSAEENNDCTAFHSLVFIIPNQSDTSDIEKSKTEVFKIYSVQGDGCHLDNLNNELKSSGDKVVTLQKQLKTPPLDNSKHGLLETILIPDEEGNVTVENNGLHEIVPLRDDFSSEFYSYEIEKEILMNILSQVEDTFDQDSFLRRKLSDDMEQLHRENSAENSDFLKEAHQTENGVIIDNSLLTDEIRDLDNNGKSPNVDNVNTVTDLNVSENYSSQATLLEASQETDNSSKGHSNGFIDDTSINNFECSQNEKSDVSQENVIFNNKEDKKLDNTLTNNAVLDITGEIKNEDERKDSHFVLSKTTMEFDPPMSETFEEVENSGRSLVGVSTEVNCSDSSDESLSSEDDDDATNDDMQEAEGKVIENLSCHSGYESLEEPENFGENYGRHMKAEDSFSIDEENLIESEEIEVTSSDHIENSIVEELRNIAFQTPRFQGSQDDYSQCLTSTPTKSASSTFYADESLPSEPFEPKSPSELDDVNLKQSDELESDSGLRKKRHGFLKHPFSSVWKKIHKQCSNVTIEKAQKYKKHQNDS